MWLFIHLSSYNHIVVTSKNLINLSDGHAECDYSEGKETIKKEKSATFLSHPLPQKR